jgi:hypothetical protein
MISSTRDKYYNHNLIRCFVKYRKDSGYVNTKIYDLLLVSMCVWYAAILLTFVAISDVYPPKFMELSFIATKNDL